MEVRLAANIVDRDTARISDAVLPTFKTLAARLQGDYGGVMEHLWIDLDLLPNRAKADGSPRHPFRFQKRVSGRGRFGLPAQPDYHNVGHFSVRPDFERLRVLPIEEVVAYALALIHRAAEVLIKKRTKLDGFDGELFMRRFRDESRALGFEFE